MKKYIISMIITIGLISNVIFTQDVNRNHGIFVESKSAFRDSMNNEAKKFRTPEIEPRTYFKMEFEEMDLPNDPDKFTSEWHNKPISQGLTGTCWCFCSTSLLESEIYRQTKQKLKISEMYTVYWETVEKARGYVQSRGKSRFSQGSLPDATLRIWKKYGVVPHEVYTGLKEGQKFHDHGAMWKEMTTYLKNIKATNNWDEEPVAQTIKSILNYYLGEPPSSFVINSKKMTPQSYLKKVVKIDPEEIIDVLSLMELPYYSVGEYIVPDNWWHGDTYHNVPLDIYMDAITGAIKSGYTVCVGGDVSEAGIDPHYEVAMIPSFDIPSEYIDENARQFRFSNRSTTDDHGLHVVGYQDRDDGTWFLIKDSGSGGHTGPHSGYYFYHEDYIILKMVNFLVHKDAISDLLKKFE